MKQLLITTIAAVLLAGCSTQPVNKVALVASLPWKPGSERYTVCHSVGGVDLKLYGSNCRTSSKANLNALPAVKGMTNVS